MWIVAAKNMVEAKTFMMARVNGGASFARISSFVGSFFFFFPVDFGSAFTGTPDLDFFARFSAQNFDMYLVHTASNLQTTNIIRENHFEKAFYLGIRTFEVSREFKCQRSAYSSVLLWPIQANGVNHQNVSRFRKELSVSGQIFCKWHKWETTRRCFLNAPLFQVDCMQ